MKRQISTLAIAFLFAFGLTATTTAQSLRFVDSEVSVEGTSTMHDWSCEVKSFSGAVSVNGGGLETISDATVAIPVSGIDCDNRRMNNLVRDAFNASQNPGITFQLTDAKVGAGQNGWSQLTITGALEMNGTKRPVTLVLDGRKNGVGYEFRGTHKLNMTDFGMRPPTAMLGAVRTGDEVTLTFKLNARS
jgi:polyisoprenoid-binding protein YceI